MELVSFANKSHECKLKMFKSKWRDSSVVHHYLEKELLESSKPSLGEWQDKHTHIKYALCTKIKLSSFLHIFAAISYCLMPQIVVRGHPLGGSSTAHAPCRAVYVVHTMYCLASSRHDQQRFSVSD